MSDPREKDVRCVSCKRFMFRIVIATENRLSIGKLGEIQKFRCYNCGHESTVLMGIFERDDKDCKDEVKGEMKEAALCDEKKA